MSHNSKVSSAVRLALHQSRRSSVSNQDSVRGAVRCALMTGAAVAVTGLPRMHRKARAPQDEVVVTGTRIRQPGVVSSSPIYSIGAEEIERQQEPELEKILRLLPVTAPSDGQNVNNGTQGAATIDLRGLGSQRTLVMMNGRRTVPFNDDGEVDTSMIPTALIERVDIITGGASAVYGSDAIAGAVNVILKDDFEGVDIRMNTSQTGESDGQDTWVGVTLGTNAADGAAEHRAQLGLPGTRPDPARRPAARPARHRHGGRRGLCGLPGGSSADASRRPAAAAPAPWRRAARRPRCRRASRSPAARAWASSATTARSAELRRVQLQPVQLLPDAARALQRHRAREPRSQRGRRSLFDVQLRQDQGRAAGRAVRRVRHRHLHAAREPADRRASARGR